MAIFKAYDIRGVVPDELDAKLAYRIGRATAHFVAAGPIAVGRDARVHSPELTQALVDGIRDEGVDVVDFGLVATPMLYFGVEATQQQMVFGLVLIVAIALTIDRSKLRTVK